MTPLRDLYFVARASCIVGAKRICHQKNKVIPCSAAPYRIAGQLTSRRPAPTQYCLSLFHFMIIMLFFFNPLLPVKMTLCFSLPYILWSNQSILLISSFIDGMANQTRSIKFTMMKAAMCTTRRFRVST